MSVVNLKYKLVFASDEDYESGLYSLEFGKHFEVFEIDFILKDKKNFTIIVGSWSDYFIEYTFRTKDTIIYKDGSRHSVPIKIYTQKWMGWDDYTRKIFKD